MHGTFVRTYMPNYMHACMHACTHTQVRQYFYASTQVRIRKYACMYASTHTHARIRKHAYACTHMHACTQVRIRMHTCACTFRFVSQVPIARLCSFLFRSMTEVSHRTHVSLREAYGSQFLYHRGTGEMMCLEKQYHIEYSPDDKGFLVEVLPPVCRGAVST
jgi:hypothetical protein